MAMIKYRSVDIQQSLEDLKVLGIGCGVDADSSGTLYVCAWYETPRSASKLKEYLESHHLTDVGGGKLERLPVIDDKGEDAWKPLVEAGLRVA